MKIKTLVIETLKKQGFINNYYCLNGITNRLGGAINYLKEDGWRFVSCRMKPLFKNIENKDFIYVVIKAGRGEVLSEKAQKEAKRLLERIKKLNILDYQNKWERNTKQK